MMGDISISVRVGAVVVTHLDSSPDDLLQRAEGASRSEDGRAAGERGTGAGRWTPVVLSSDRTPESKSWAEALQEALENRQFVALAQPLMSLGASKPLRRFELLVRLAMPDGQLLAVPRFDQLAQRMGFGPVVDHWMIDRALELLAAAPDLELEVNIAPSSLSDLGFVAELAMRIEELGGVSNRLLLALTERSVLDDVTQALRFSDEARALNLRIVLDEFMAAQDGGSYLESLGISRVKLSGRLIRAAVNGTSERQMIAELAKTAHENGVEVAAPFVTEPHMIDELRSLGVDFAQGYLIGSPVPVADLLVSDAG
jgi:EAL domain-containing protein (putative c-di-GMP-specific phosphodiesterase class I)